MHLRILISAACRTKTKFTKVRAAIWRPVLQKGCLILRKASYILLTVLLFVCVFSACKAKNSDKDTPQNTVTSAATDSAVTQPQTGSKEEGADTSSALLTTNVPDIGEITVTTSKKQEGGSSSAGSSAIGTGSKNSSGSPSSSAGSSTGSTSGTQSKDDGFIPGYY